MAYLDLMVSAAADAFYSGWSTYSGQIGLLYNNVTAESDGAAQGNNPIPIPNTGYNYSSGKKLGFKRGSDSTAGTSITHLIMWCNTDGSSNSDSAWNNIELRGTIGTELSIKNGTTYPFTNPGSNISIDTLTWPIYDSFSKSTAAIIFASNSSYINIDDVADNSTLGYFYLRVANTATAYGTWQLAFTYQYRVS